LLHARGVLCLPVTERLGRAFQKRGFVLIPQVLAARDLSLVVDEALEFVGREAALVERRDTNRTLWYRVVTGDRIQRAGSRLFGLYSSPQMVAWVMKLTRSRRVSVSEHVRSAININCLDRVGQRYPWHRDAQPYTAVLFLTSVPARAGGCMVIRAADDERVAIPARAGDLLIMDGARCPHCVTALREPALRLSVPMVYPVRCSNRPKGLDAYLYGPGAPGP
jgi:hypothetical protein